MLDRDSKIAVFNNTKRVQDASLRQKRMMSREAQPGNICQPSFRSPLCLAGCDGYERLERDARQPSLQVIAFQQGNLIAPLNNPQPYRFRQFGRRHIREGGIGPDDHGRVTPTC